VVVSKCSACGGTGKVTCPTCHGEGFFSRVSETGETVRRLCAYCGGDRKVRCGACHGTGEIAPVHEPAGAAPAAPKPRPANQPDRLAGRWTGQQGTWIEFVPDGPRYKATAGGLRGVSGSGTATLKGSKVAVDANDVLCGHYQLELNLQGDHMDGIDRKAGFPIPVSFNRVMKAS
jgi:hypothetical protein